MAEQTGSANEEARQPADEERGGDEQQDELEAEQESAAAMDADVPHPPDTEQA